MAYSCSNFFTVLQTLFIAGNSSIISTVMLNLGCLNAQQNTIKDKTV